MQMLEMGAGECQAWQQMLVFPFLMQTVPVLHVDLLEQRKQLKSVQQACIHQNWQPAAQMDSVISKA